MSQPLEEERRVVPFAVPSGRARRRVVADQDGRGAVLLFTGVRYQRAEAAESVFPIRPKPADPHLRS